MDLPDSNTRIFECTNAYTDASTGTSHLGDVGRSNVLQLVRLRKGRRRKKEKQKRERVKGERARRSRSRGVDKSQGIRGIFPQYGFTERYDLCSLRLPSIILRQI